jgi:tetratricopeptide (TPR) repeat protein
VASSLVRQADARLALDRAGEALALAERALAVARAAYGDDHPLVGDALARRAAALDGLGDLAASESAWTATLAARRRSSPGDHVETAAALLGLGEARLDGGRAGDAEPLLREAQAMLERLVPPGHWRRGVVDVALGSCALALGRGDEAATLLDRGLANLCASRGAAHPLTRQARARRAALGDGSPPAPC